jgi:hypothetical protein
VRVGLVARARVELIDLELKICKSQPELSSFVRGSSRLNVGDACTHQR